MSKLVSLFRQADVWADRYGSPYSVVASRNGHSIVEAFIASECYPANRVLYTSNPRVA